MKYIVPTIYIVTICLVSMLMLKALGEKTVIPGTTFVLVFITALKIYQNDYEKDVNNE